METEQNLIDTMVGHVRDAVAFVGQNPYLQALVVVLVFFVAAWLADRLITRGVVRLVRRTRSEIDDRIVALLHRPVYLTVSLLGLLSAALIILPEDEGSLRGITNNVFATLIILIWITFGLRVANTLLSSVTLAPGGRRIIQPATRPLFEVASKLTVLALGVYFILASWGVDPIGWLATAGIAALAVGLAAQETLGNLFAGISILADAPYKIGDYIVLNKDERGKVTKIGLRSTRILTRDDLEITVPNSAIARSTIINESSGRWIKQRLRIPVGVAYGSDVDLVKRVLVEAAKSEELVCDTPEPWVQFRAFGDSSLNFEIRCWIDDPSSRGRALDAVNTAAYKKLAEQGLEIPFPQRDLYIKELPSRRRGTKARRET